MSRSKSSYTGKKIKRVLPNKEKGGAKNMKQYDDSFGQDELDVESDWQYAMEEEYHLLTLTDKEFEEDAWG